MPSLRNRTVRFFLYIVFSLLMVGIQSSCGDTLEIITVTIEGHTLELEVARTDEEQARGLMFRKSMPDDHGMLFPYTYDRPLSFWMKDTTIPLSIAFIASDGTIKNIRDMTPLSENTIESRQSVRYALEVNQGLFERLGVGVGDKVVFPEDFR